MMNTTPFAAHFSLSNDGTTTDLYSLFLPNDIFDNTIVGNGLRINTSATLKPFNEYIS